MVLAGDYARGVWFVVVGVFVCLEIVVVYKSSHVNGKGFLAGGRVVCWASGELGLEVAVDTAVKPPNAWRASAALTCAVDACFVGVRVGFVGNAKSCFNKIFSMIKHVTLYGGYFGWNAMAETDDGGQVHYDPVVTRFCVVAEFEMSQSCEGAVLGL